MKTYRNEQHGFEIDVPETWNLPKGDAIKTPFGESIAFGCDTNEDFNFQIGQSTPESLDQPEREFRRYAQVKQYSGLELGRIAVGDGNHIWARYHTGSRDWKKKYLIVFDEIEYTITATCYDKNTFAERESIWDSIARSFRLIGPAKPRTPLGKIEPTKPRSPASKLERANQAVQFAERGHSYFNSSQYQQALEEFEKGKMVTHEVPWNFLGASMTYMQMVVTGAVPEDQVIIYVERAEKNIQACLLISPRDQVYLDAKRNIEDYRKRHNI